MALSSGASSAKRKAKKAAAQQYYEAFGKLQEIPDVGSIATNNKREVDEKLGNQASFRTRNMAQKADRAAREFKNDPEYKKNVAAYNDRYAILKDQIANKSSTRYSVAKDPIQPQNTNVLGGTSYFGIGSANQTKGIGGIQNTLMKPEVKGKYFESQNNNAPLYKTREEALELAKQRMNEYNAALDKSPSNFGLIAFGGRSPQKVTDPNQFVQQNDFNGFGVLYRNLGAAEDAAADLTNLGKKVTGTQANKALEQYLKIAERLKPMLKRDAQNASVITDGQSMVAGELAQAAPYTETIK